MAAAELTVPAPPAANPTWAVETAIALGGLAVLTAIAAAIELAAPGLYSSQRPHPALHAKVGAITSIWLTNLRVLFAPFGLILLKAPASRAGRLIGDLLIACALGLTAIQVGLALGRWQDRLLPYLPHLPLEYLAAALAGGAWLTARQRQPAGGRVIAQAAATAGLALLAAAIEVLATPHVR